MEIMKMKLSELRPAQYNPRKALRPGDPAYEKLKNSILTFGNVEPIVWNRTTGNVVGGHQRLSVLLDLGVEESEVSVVDLTEVEEKQLNIALNKITGEWDEEKLVILLSDITGEGADATVTGFDEKELELLFAELADADPAEDNFDVEAELQKPPITKSGDLWLLGQHRLVCGDSTKKETFDLLMDGKLANLVVTDPPYNVDYEGVAGKFKNDHMASEAFYTFLLAAFQNTEAAMAQDASIYVFHADTEGLNFRRAFADAGFYLSGTCIWKKQSIVMGRSPYQWQHEPVLFGWKRKGKHQWYSDRKQSTIWEFDRPTRNPDHPTMKPVDLIEHPIINSSLTNCIVLDPFGGSGTTLIACERKNRICYTIELEEKFCDVIVKRFIEHAGSDQEVRVLRDGKEYAYREVQGAKVL